MNQPAEKAKQLDDIPPEIREEIIEAMNTPLEDCIDEKDIAW